MRRLTTCNLEVSEDDDNYGPVGAIDGSVSKQSSIWATEVEEESVELPASVLGVLSGEAEREGRSAIKSIDNPAKRQRT